MLIIRLKSDAPQGAGEAYEELKEQLAKLPCMKRMVTGIT
jgi:hypothetical protein